MKTMALLAILAGGLWSLGVSTPPAEATLLQQQIDHVLLEYPGGVQTGPGEVTWEAARSCSNSRILPEGP